LIPVTKLEEMGLTFEHWMAACLQAEAKAVDAEELLLRNFFSSKGELLNTGDGIWSTTFH